MTNYLQHYVRLTKTRSRRPEPIQAALEFEVPIDTSEAIRAKPHFHDFEEGRSDAMPTLCLLIVVRLIEALCKQMGKARTTKPLPLCTECGHAHVQYAASGHRAIACTFAGGARPVTIDVIYCTDYRDRNAAPRVVTVGFAREIEDTAAKRRDFAYEAAATVAVIADGQQPRTNN
jgi:hypothetical protein